MDRHSNRSYEFENPTNKPPPVTLLVVTPKRPGHRLRSHRGGSCELSGSNGRLQAGVTSKRCKHVSVWKRHGMARHATAAFLKARHYNTAQNLQTTPQRASGEFVPTAVQDISLLSRRAICAPGRRCWLRLANSPGSVRQGEGIEGRSHPGGSQVAGLLVW